MCGIAGIWQRAGEPVHEPTLERMGDILAHRGPDGSGTYVDGAIGLTSRRLRVIDISPAADQPMGLGDGSVWLTYNGEIHNYMDLRRELEAGGTRFLTHTDTEVVLQAYAAWGCDCFARFNGMWALALWDARRAQLVLSRDRFGIKPLYYSVRGERVCFASEAKAILAAFPQERVANAGEVGGFLAGGATDVGGETFFANVGTLSPATYTVFERERTRTTTYWDFEPGEETPKPDAEERFRDLLGDSVRLRTRSDVALGCCLSGGLDSSAIVALLDRSGGQPMDCFSLHYDEASFDESRYAKIAARGRNLDMHWVRPDPRELIETMRSITWHRDAPSMMRGCGQWFVMREAGQHVKVLLDGQGGDELLAGYSHYVVPYLLDRVRLGPPGNGLLSEVAALGRLETPRPWFLAATPLRHVSRSRSQTTRPYASALNNMLWNDLVHRGLPQIVHDEDASSMAFSVETRTPFLDHRLVELCFSLPYYDKIADGWTKSLMRRSLAGVVPPEILARRRKLGFSAPVSSWLGLEPNRRATRELLLDPRTRERGLVDAGKLERELRRVRPGASPYPSLHARRLWRWITLELWFRDFIDGEGFAARG